MLIIGNRTLHDSIYGMVYRVTVGALLSITDAVTDIYAILTYYKTPELISQANILLTMILTNTFIQLLFVLLQYKRKSNKTKLNEILITLFFLRPAVDAVRSERASCSNTRRGNHTAYLHCALSKRRRVLSHSDAMLSFLSLTLFFFINKQYRVSTNHEDNETTVDSLTQMMINKGLEVSSESFPGLVLQIYVWLKSPQDAGRFALASIGISALTTGFTSAMIAFDKDVEVGGRKRQPKFYGYIPDVRSERAKRASCSNTCRGNHAAYSNCALFDKQASRRVATHCFCRSEA